MKAESRHTAETSVRDKFFLNDNDHRILTSFAAPLTIVQHCGRQAVVKNFRVHEITTRSAHSESKERSQRYISLLGITIIVINLTAHECPSCNMEENVVTIHSLARHAHCCLKASPNGFRTARKTIYNEGHYNQHC